MAKRDLMMIVMMSQSEIQRQNNRRVLQLLISWILEALSNSRKQAHLSNKWTCSEKWAAPRNSKIQEACLTLVEVHQAATMIS
jgi:hypothetical protein